MNHADELRAIAEDGMDADGAKRVLAAADHIVRLEQALTSIANLDDVDSDPFAWRTLATQALDGAS